MNEDKAVPDGNQYHDDFHAWALDQAEKLRVASSVQVAELEGIDFEHVIEEVEDLGISERRQVSSNLGVALEHMIKVASLPETEFVPGWRREIIAAIRNARRSFTPSMSQRLDIQKIWLEAREDALQMLIDDGVKEADIPEASPLTLQQMLDAETPALQLLAIVMEVIPTDRFEM
jgi:hypothetical protein